MKEKKFIYINSCIEKKEIIYTGITFDEFMDYLQNPIEKILLLKSDYIADKCFENFEVLDGVEKIDEFRKEKTYKHGDFCFVDFSEYETMRKINNNQIAELLFLAHMFKPLVNPFYSELNNRFVYLSHDDGFFGKMFCCNVMDFAQILNEKIINSIKTISKMKVGRIDFNVQRKLLDLSEKGILLDIDDIIINNESIIFKIYIIGKVVDMNQVINNSHDLKEKSITVKILEYTKNSWYIT